MITAGGPLGGNTGGRTKCFGNGCVGTANCTVSFAGPDALRGTLGQTLKEVRFQGLGVKDQRKHTTNYGDESNSSLFKRRQHHQHHSLVAAATTTTTTTTIALAQ